MKSNIKPQEVEVINAGKRLVRTNITPHYLPLDESKITQIEVPDMDGEGTHFEIRYPEPEIDYWTYDERIEYKGCYVLLTPDAYVALNEALSTALGYLEGLSTEVYNTENPPISNGLCVMVLTAEVQERFPELLQGLELVDSYVADEVIENTEVNE